MSYYIFRNNTVEPFFPKECMFSGYDDISYVPIDSEGYVWFYQLPVKYDQDKLVDEVKVYIQKFQYVLSRVNPNKTFIAFTMEIFYNILLTDDDFKLARAVSDYNTTLYQLGAQYKNIKIIDIKEFTNKYSSDELIDWKFYFIAQLGINPKLAIPFKIWFRHKLDNIALKRKKCLILDLDNTLWGGILGEDGIDGIQIGADYPGKAFLFWQEALIQFVNHGVILAICSKNNEQDVWEALEKNPYIILKKDCFSAYRINWQDKASNIREIAQELNIGLDSCVFVDDNPTERELIKQMLPMVAVPDFPEQPYMLPMFIKRLVDDYFKVYNITNEDRNKTEQYIANVARTHAQAMFADYEQFLESLNIQITIEPANRFNIQRIAQMTQKTNQFNLTTKRYTDADIKSFIEDGWKIWCIRVADKFGDNGITGCIMVKGNEIDTFLLSCRILGKGIEIAFAKTIMLLLYENGVQYLTAKYIPTAKNAQVSNFYEKCGLTCLTEYENGVKDYHLDLHNADFEYKNYYHITIK